METHQQHLTELRRKAEEQLSAMVASLPEKSPEDVQALLHDLHVHQIELTLQNEELRIAQAELEFSRQSYADLYRKYANLYEFAPVGYCTLDSSGVIRVANLTAVRQLGVERTALLETRIYKYIFEDDRDTLFTHLREAFSTGSRQICELRLKKPDGAFFWARLDSIAVSDEYFSVPSRTAEAAASGSAKQCLTTITDISERKRAEELLKKTLTEKEALMKELLHRTKNNMGMIISLLNLVAARYQDSTPMLFPVFQDIENRIHVMLLVQQQLYQTEHFSQVDLKDYLDTLVPTVFHNLRISAVRLYLHTVSVIVGPDRAITCGLLLNELLTNALKHAFPQAYAGQSDEVPEIQVVLQRLDADMVELRVSDNGVGLPPDFEPDTRESLGLSLVAAFTQQLRGTFELIGNHGTSWNIRFPQPL